MPEFTITTSVSAVQNSLSHIRGPINLMFDITRRCNFHCMHCYNASSSTFDQDLNDSEILEIAAQIKDIKPMLVCICGGEPLLRMSLVLEIISMLHESGIVVNMVTNGFLASEVVIKELFSAGLSNIQISLDSNRAEIHDAFRNMHGAHEHATQAIKNVLAIGHAPSVTFIPTKFNYEDVGGVIDWLVSIGIYTLKSMPFISLGRGSQNNANLKMDNSDNWEFLTIVISALRKHEKVNFNFDFGDPLEHIYLFRNNYLAKTLTYEIKSNGDILISPYLPYTFGNVKNSMNVL